MSKETKIKDTKRVLVSDLFGTDMKKLFVHLDTEWAIPISREYIPLLADEACVKPCMLLYDMGIRTVNSGANVAFGDTASNCGFIGIDYNSLSDENKIIADTLIERGIIGPIYQRKGTIFLETPLTGESTVGEVEQKLMELASLFQPQDVLYGRKTIEDIQNEFVDNGNGTYYWKRVSANFTHEEMKILMEEDMKELQNWFYDGEKYYYITEELLNIHMNYINKNKKGKKENIKQS